MVLEVPSWLKEGTGNCSIGEIMMVISAPTHPFYCLSSHVALYIVGSRSEIIAFQYCEGQMDVIHNHSVVVLKSKMHTQNLKQWFIHLRWRMIDSMAVKKHSSFPQTYDTTGRRAVVLANIIFSISSDKNDWRKIWYLCYSFTHRLRDHCISLGSLLRCSFNILKFPFDVRMLW